MMRSDVAAKLGLSSVKTKVNMTTVKDSAEPMNVEVISLRVASQDGSYEIDIKEVYLCPSGRFNMPSRPQLGDVCNTEMYTHLDGI